MNTQHSKLLTFLKQRLPAAVLLVAVLFTLTPSGVFHHHHEDGLCEQNDPHVENDPCHVTLHHADESGLAHCSHAVHVEAENEECYICQYLSHHPGYECIVRQQDETLLPIFAVKAEEIQQASFFSKSVEAPFNKGPPVI